MYKLFNIKIILMVHLKNFITFPSSEVFKSERHLTVFCIDPNDLALLFITNVNMQISTGFYGVKWNSQI